jgi:hypothetical protein
MSFFSKLLSKGPAKKDDAASIKLPAQEVDSASIEPRVVIENGLPMTITALAFHPIQRVIAVGAEDGTVVMYSLFRKYLSFQFRKGRC